MCSTAVVSRLKNHRTLLFCLLVTLMGCDASNRDIDLASPLGSSGFRASSGIAANDFSGYSVSGAGDVNGDHIDDFVIGEVNSDRSVASTIRTDSGVSYVIFGRDFIGGALSYADINLAAINADGSYLGFAIFGAATNDYSGQSVSAAGDVNDDGLADVLVGAWQADPVINSIARGDAGAAYVVFGRPISSGAASYANIDLADFMVMTGNTPLGFAMLGPTSGAYVGQSVSKAGDFNGDGVDDVIVGAYLADPNVGGVRTDAGSSYVIFGRSKLVNEPASYIKIDLDTMYLAGTAFGFPILGAAGGDNSGFSVSGGADINKDGLDDVIVGSRWATPVVGGDTRSGGGIVYVVFGRSVADYTAASYPGVDLLTISVTGSAIGFPIFGALGGGGSGYAVSAGGDINGDGVKDVIVGTYAAGFTIGGTVRTNAGTAFVVLGRSKITHATDYYTGIDLLPLLSTSSSLGYAVWGAASDDNIGRAVSCAGDVNGDGIDDVILGAFVASAVVNGVSRGNAAGIAYIVYGRRAYTNVDLLSLTLSSAQGYRILGAASADYTGFSVSGLGDVNEDGVADFIVGAHGTTINTISAAGRSFIIFGSIAQPTSQPSSQPSRQPSAQPSQQPQSQPSSQPSGQPSCQPSAQPADAPSTQPTSQPSSLPSRQPTAQPSSQPSLQPSSQPSSQPNSAPSGQPSAAPTVQPSAQPTTQPSVKPTGQPSNVPSSSPTTQPTSIPSCKPSAQPSCQPTAQPSYQPSVQPSGQPSYLPSAQPSKQPTSVPSAQPSRHPTARPSVQPTCQPSALPTGIPSVHPSTIPSVQPTAVPSAPPSTVPTVSPTSQPSVQPVGVPTSPPSTVPSPLPTSEPSCVPTVPPSTLPSSQPTGAPTGQPSPTPSSAPNSQPSSRPSRTPSTQPSSAPTSSPTTQPVSSPTSPPSGQPTAQPSLQPSAVPSLQPSQQPRASPRAPPSGVPSTRPSQPPTGEWVTVNSAIGSDAEVLYAGDRLWVCGKKAILEGVACVIIDPKDGILVSRFVFDWDSVTSILPGASGDTIITSSTIDYAGAGHSDVARCTPAMHQLQCAVLIFYGMRFMDSTYVPYPKKFIHVGLYNVYPSVTIVDAVSGAVQSYMYTASNMKALQLLHVLSPPAFVGGFIAGTAVRATAAPVNYIIAGMVRTEAGILSGMALMPQNDDIVSSVNLVNALALETTGPDSFVAGGLELSDGAGMHGYVLRANALFMSIQYCKRYRTSGIRRALSTTSTAQSVVRGVALAGSVLFVVLDYTRANTTSLTVLKTTSTTGSIIKQVHIFAPNATLSCTSVVVVEALLNIMCSLSNASLAQSVLFAADFDLSFAMLPAGFVRSKDPILQADNVPFQRTVLTITKASVTVPTTAYQYDTAGNEPSRRPSTAPTRSPSLLPSSAPSAQPSSSPTSSPSVSPQPTSTPSSAVPTVTHKPTPEPTVVPTDKPTFEPTARPSFRPTIVPTGAPMCVPTVVPTVKPSTKPSAMPSVKPVSAPSLRPTVVPSARPTPAMSSSQPTVEEFVVSASNSRLPPYVVGASVGGGLGLLLIGYFVYQYYQNDKEAKARELRKAEYYRQQAILVAQSRAETAKYIQEENDRLAAIKLKKEERRANRHSHKEHNYCDGARAGAYATSPVHGAHVINSLESPGNEISSFPSVRVNSLNTAAYVNSQSGRWETEEDANFAEGISDMNSSELSDIIGELMRSDDGSGDGENL